MRTRIYKRTAEGFFYDSTDDLISFNDIDPAYHNEPELVLELNPETCTCDTMEKMFNCCFSRSLDECSKTALVEGDFYGIKAKRPINIVSPFKVIVTKNYPNLK